MKKIVSVFLLILMLANVCSMTSCDFMKQEEGSDGLVFKLNEDGETCTLIGTHNCMDTNIVIPSNFKGKNVTKISSQAFSQYRGVKIETITLPKTITFIEENALCLQVDKIITSKPLPVIESISEEEYTFIRSLTESVGDSTILVFTDGILYKKVENGFLDAILIPGWSVKYN